MKSTYIIYLIGHPGTGKYTIAKELAQHNFIICDNQLINNPIFSLLNYDGLTKIPAFAWRAIGGIRNAILDFLATKDDQNYVLTNCLYEAAGDRKCYVQVKNMASQRGSLFVPVKLMISEAENLKRITEPSRRERWKSIDPKDVLSQRKKLINIEHPHLLTLDVSELSAMVAAERILEHVARLQKIEK
jgi:hypothetical protein